MLLAIVTACMGRGVGSVQVGGSKRDGGAANEAVSNLPFPVDAGYFDKDFDYTQHERFKVAYLVAERSIGYLNISFDNAFALWASRINIDYLGMHVVSENTKKSFIALVQTYIDLGIDGILFDGRDDNVEPIFEMCYDAGVAIWRCMSVNRDSKNTYIYGDTYVGGALLYPIIQENVEYKNYVGVDKLLEWKESAYPLVPWDNVGCICVGASTPESSYKLVLSVEKRWSEANPAFGNYDEDRDTNPDNFWFADISTADAMADYQTVSYRLVTDIVASRDDIEVWFIPALADVLAIGAADALERFGLTDKSCIYSSFSNYDLMKYWTTDDFIAWRYASYDSPLMLTEPMICALWALMARQCTPETLWPQWVKPWDKGDVFEFEDDKPRANVANALKLGSDGKPIVAEEHSYAQALFPTNWIDRENYREFFAWTDLYLYGDDIDSYIYKDYPRVYDINLYRARVTVPDGYYTSPLD